MSAPIETNASLVLCIIGNIPPYYRSSDLRNYFSQFIESGGFNCFHFRHRPETKQLKNVPESSVSDSVLTVTVANVARSTVTASASTTTTSSGTQSCTTEGEGSKSRLSDSVMNTTCCVVRLANENVEKLIKMYHRKHWLDKEGNMIQSKCFIAKLRTSSDNDTGTASSKYVTRKEQRQIDPDREQLTDVNIRQLAELHPPPVMPQGNVGTPVTYFLEQIRLCRMPGHLIKQLGLQFPKSRSNRRYGNVPCDYGGETYSRLDTEEDEVITASGMQLSDVYLKTQMPSETRKDDNNSISNDTDSGEDDDTGEEWDRYESFHNDVTSQDRTKERLYEEEMEVTWEKGGPGLVWHTDAAYWDQLEGDFDERTADEWDVDMSVWYEPLGGDKDSRDFVQMRREQRRRAGIEATDMFTAGFGDRKKRKKVLDPEESQKIGKFEKYTKGFGRKIMEHHGWKEGQGLGKMKSGISEAVELDGQAGKSKIGFGIIYNTATMARGW
ncbi:PREDICTED: G patch domain-containing protein 3-like isoform X2 [Priapulus caudatus]|uniref:G patch domain-containing protein 3-like isoform X2 n=1 Tax=Priapulus caudatus TaxID=37621 RepID=A0ABM1E1L2_PRICU|nr:PREDICTED: G patch domain-containing protein 3-like isoform X2 [Priapulus caudatus]